MNCECGEYDCLPCHRSLEREQETPLHKTKQRQIRGKKKQHQLIEVDDLPEYNNEF